MMRVFLKVCFVLLSLVRSGIAAQTQIYYVDPDFSGGGRNGAASTPWQSPSDGSFWTDVNTALANSNVTIYASARAVGADTNQLTTTQWLLNRTDLGPNTLTLHGSAKWNSNDSTPSWSDYTGDSHFWIHSTYPLNSNNTGSPYTRRVNLVIIGFFLQATDGQVAGLYGTSNTVFAFNWCTADSGAATGPGVHFAVPFQLNDGTIGGSHPSYITCVSNRIWNTFGEGIYIGGSTPDPPGVAGTVFTGSNFVIAYNFITNAAARGGQSDHIDIKDGNRFLYCSNNVCVGDAFSGADGSGIIAESGDVIAGNLVIGGGTMNRNGIVIAQAWDNLGGRLAGITVYNNRIITAVAHGIRNVGASAAAYQWTNVFFYNNSIYSPAGGSGINLSGNLGPSQIKNNILYGAGSLEFPYDTATGMTVVHSNNVIYNPSDSARYAHGEGNFFGSSDVLTFEPSCVKVDPLFSSTATLVLSGSSPAINSGATLTQFSTDCFGTTRPQGSAWDIGAYEFFPIGADVPAAIGTGRGVYLIGR